MEMHAVTIPEDVSLKNTNRENINPDLSRSFKNLTLASSHSKNGFLKKYLLIKLLTCIALGTSQYSGAQMVQNTTVANAKALALGHAVTADPVGIDSIHFNPAGLTHLPEGRSVELKFMAVDFGVDGKITEPKENPFNNNIVIDLGDGEACWDECMLGDDPLANSETHSIGTSAVLPFFGRVDLPSTLAAPLLGVAFRPPESRWTFATAVYTPMAGAIRRADDDPGVFQGRNYALTRINFFNPSFGYRINDQWSIGLALTMSYMGATVDMDLRMKHVAFGLIEEFLDDEMASSLFDLNASISPMDKLVRMDAVFEDYFTPGFNFGVLWEPTDWFSWGFVYQSEATDHLKGDIDVYYSDNWNALWSAIQESSIAGPAVNLVGGIAGITIPDGTKDKETVSAEMEFIVPQHASTGVSVKFLPRWKFNMDFKFYDAGVWEEWRMAFTSPNDLIGLLRLAGITSDNSFPIPRGYKSSTSFAYGLEHTFSDQLTLRLGYEPRGSSIPKDKLDLLAPLSGFDSIAVGGEWRFPNKATLDFAFTYMSMEEFIPAGGSSNVNSVDPADIVYNPYAGLDVSAKVEVAVFSLLYHRKF